ncbi:MULTISPECIES: lipid A hydroxylase LpxO [unclassified Variovorax]|uniref:lipid A hydroxylase LpxO n=1 Tax=unclassified Variovorax TaxID=663243 RepID=UPI00257879AA|nr:MULTISPECIES: lipid A hydroxylase LpxO [unclassified Variovorax]MDM0087600.1 lipid A hydroxylase LpxO [Variovorax sp. J22G40]MDM0144143.1 lipid A hydroxylase LpxO [Variovorax sp. J2P1-31]
MKWIVLAIFVLSALYVHFRGQVRHRFLRQLSDHSSFLAPLNVFMYMFSKVPSTPYLSPAEFPEMRVLEQNWEIIREEALAMRNGGSIKASSQFNDVGFNSFFKSGWKRFYLKWYDEAHPSAAVLCPRTTELLKGLGTVKAAMFAELPPGSRLVRHRDPFAGSLRYHLGLWTPGVEGCYIDVDGQRYHWRDGEAVVFDETYIHYAENTTDHDRVILFCDIERPMKYRWAMAVNRWFAKNVLAAASSPNDAGDKTGGINRAFKYIYQVRVIGKRLKAWDRRAYYLVKWAIFGGLALWIFY